MQKLSKEETEQSYNSFQECIYPQGVCTVCGDWWTDLSNKNCWFPKHKDYPTVNDRRKGNGNEGKSINPMFLYRGHQ